MAKYPIYIILTGVLLVLSSCVPMLQTAFRVMAPTPPQRVELLPGRATEKIVTVADSDEVVFALALEFDAADREAAATRYTYELKTAEKTVQRDAGIIEPDSAHPVNSSGAVHQTFIVEKRFPLLRLDKHARELTVLVRLEEVAPMSPAPLSAYALIFPDPPHIRLSFVSALVIWTLGILLALGGAIQWIRGIAETPARTAIPSDGDRERFWCMLCHLSALLGYILPFGHLVLPLLIWSTKRDRIRRVDAAGCESLNFQLTITSFALVGVLLSVVFVGVVLLFLVVVFHVTMTLYASLREQRGEEFRYPLNIRIIKPA